MRFIIFSALALAAITSQAHAASLTVVLDYESAPSDQAVSEMKHEFETILKRSGWNFEYKTRKQAEQIASEYLAVVHFTGDCALKPSTDRTADRRALGYSYIMDGSVLPFGEIACDRVATVVNSAIYGADYLRSDLLMGRALGRVLAHEVVHILNHNRQHGKRGVMCKDLTGQQLVAPGLSLLSEDLALPPANL